jgi:hypothetical protein
LHRLQHANGPLLFQALLTFSPVSAALPHTTSLRDCGTHGEGGPSLTHPGERVGAASYDCIPENDVGPSAGPGLPLNITESGEGPLPLLGMLIVLETSVAALSRIHGPDIGSLKRVVAGWGLAIQLLFDVFVFQLFLIGYDRIDIAWGFVVVLIGFIVTLIGASVGVSRQGHERANQS